MQDSAEDAGTTPVTMEVEDNNEQPKETPEEQQEEAVKETEEGGGGEEEEQSEKEEEGENGEEVEQKRKPAKRKEPAADADAGRYSKRQRKQVVQWQPADKKEAKDLVIPQGAGTPLGDHPNVKRNLNAYQSLDPLMKTIHKVLYGTPGKKTTVKKEIRAFSGYSAEGEESKNKAFLDKQSVDVLKAVARVLDVRDAISGSKEEIAEALFKFLNKPEPSEGNGLQPTKAGSKKGKKKTASKKGKGQGKKAKEKRAPSAYILFCNDEREKVKSEMPELTSLGDVAKELGKRWKSLSEKEQDKYKAQASAGKPAKKKAKSKEASETEDDSESEDEHLGLESKMRAKIRVLLKELSVQGEVSSKQVRKSLADAFGDVVEQKKAWVKELIRNEYQKQA